MYALKLICALFFRFPANRKWNMSITTKVSDFEILVLDNRKTFPNKNVCYKLIFVFNFFLFQTKTTPAYLVKDE